MAGDHDFASSISRPPPNAYTSGASDSFGDYDLLEELGRGGMGVVWKARQHSLNRLVAIKLIQPGLDSAQVLARFDAERQAFALMDHPHIARVFDAGTTPGGWPYFVMELVAGVPLTRYCDERRFGVRARLELFGQVCQAIHHAHQKGVIHRDIKPSNVLVTELDGRAIPKIIDFGIAKAIGPRLTPHTLQTDVGKLVGTLEYMSPEQTQVNSIDVDTRSDIYSLGVLLYQTLTGTTPLDPKGLRQGAFDAILQRIREEEPPRPSVRIAQESAQTAPAGRPRETSLSAQTLRGDVDWIVMKALEKDRNRRYESAAALGLDLRRYLANEPVEARPPSRFYRLQKLVRRNKITFAAASTVVVSLAVGLLLSTNWFLKERSARKRAVAAEEEQGRLRQDAQTEAAKSQQVAKFLKQMLAGVGPSMARGSDTKLLREILDKTAERVGLDLTNQPLVEAELRNTIGRVYGDIGQFEKAEAMQRRALALSRQYLGEHRDTALVMNHLFSVIVRRGKAPEAEALVREAIEIQRKILGNEHLEIASSLVNLGNALVIQKQLGPAELQYREAVTMERKLAGTNDPQIAPALVGLANVFSTQNRQTESLPLLREAVAILNHHLGPADPQTSKARTQLGMDLAQVGQLAESEMELRIALTNQIAFLSGTHPEVGYTRYLLEEVLWREGKKADAIAILAEREAVARQRVDGARSHADALGKMVRWLLEDGQLAKAESTSREYLALRQKLSPDSPFTAQAKSLLGAVLVRQSRFQEGEPLLIQAYEELKTLFSSQASSSQRQFLKEAGERLLTAYETSGKSAEATRLRQELATIPVRSQK